jgi:hypothetical protein
VVGVEQWAEIRRLHRVELVSIRDISQRTGVASQDDPAGVGGERDAEVFAACERIQARSV